MAWMTENTQSLWQITFMVMFAHVCCVCNSLKEMQFNNFISLSEIYCSLNATQKDKPVK